MASKKRGTAVAAAAAEVPGPEPAPAKRARVTTEAPGPAGFLGRVKALTMEAARDQRVSWDEYFGGMALRRKKRARPARARVAASLRDRRVLSMRYNGFFQGAPHQSIMAHGHEQATVHAEQNAIAHAARVGISLGGCAFARDPCVLGTSASRRASGRCTTSTTTATTRSASSSPRCPAWPSESCLVAKNGGPAAWAQRGCPPEEQDAVQSIMAHAAVRAGQVHAEQP